MPAGSLAGISFTPVVADRIAGAGEPFFVVAQLLKNFRGKKLRAVSRRMAKRFQHACGNKDRNLMYLKTQEPSGLSCIETSRSDFPAQEIVLLCYFIHAIGLRHIRRGQVYGLHKTRTYAFKTRTITGLRPAFLPCGLFALTLRDCVPASRRDLAVLHLRFSPLPGSELGFW